MRAPILRGLAQVAVIAAMACGAILLALANAQVAKVVTCGNGRLASAGPWADALALLCSLAVVSAGIFRVLTFRRAAAVAAVSGVALCGMWLGMAVASVSIPTDDVVFRLGVDEARVLNLVALLAMAWLALAKSPT